MATNKIQIDLEVKNKASDEVRKFSKDAEAAFDKVKSEATKTSSSMGGAFDKFKEALAEVKSATLNLMRSITDIGSTSGRKFTDMSNDVKAYKKSVDIADTAVRNLQNSLSATARLKSIQATVGDGGGAGGIGIGIGGGAAGVAAGAAGAMAGAAGVGAASVAALQTAQAAAMKLDDVIESLGGEYKTIRELIEQNAFALREMEKAGVHAFTSLQQKATIPLLGGGTKEMDMSNYQRTATRLNDLYALVGLKMKETDEGMEKINSTAEKQTTVMQRLKKYWLAYAGAIYAAYRFLKSSYEAYAESAKAQSNLEAVLKATGYAAGWSAEQLNEHAAELQKTTGIADNAVTKVQALIATFKNIRGEQFKEVTELALDLSMVMGGDATSAAMQLAKALEDPAEGLSALARAGIKFSDWEKEAIQINLEHGRVLEAQTMVLAKVKTHVQGVAKAFGETDVGKLEEADKVWTDMQESVGKLVSVFMVGLIPAMKWFTSLLKEAADYWVKIFGGDRLADVAAQFDNNIAAAAKKLKDLEGWKKYLQNDRLNKQDQPEVVAALKQAELDIETQKKIIALNKKSKEDMYATTSKLPGAPDRDKVDAGRKAAGDKELADTKTMQNQLNQVINAGFDDERKARLAALDIKYQDYQDTNNKIQAEIDKVNAIIPKNEAEKFAKEVKLKELQSKTLVGIEQAKALEIAAVESAAAQKSLDDYKSKLAAEQKLEEDIDKHKFDVSQADLRMAGQTEEAEIAAVNRKYDALKKEYGLWVDFTKAREEEISVIKAGYRQKEVDEQRKAIEDVKALQKELLEEWKKENAHWIEIADTVKTTFADAFTDFVSGAKSAKESFSDMASSIGRDLIRIATQMMFLQAIKSVFGANSFMGNLFGLTQMAEGGVTPKIPGAAGGAAFSGPTSGYPIMAHGNEAVIPLQNGAVPVRLSGGGGGMNIVNHISVNSGGSSDPGESLKLGRDLARIIKTEIRTTIAEENRTGGINRRFYRRA